MFHKVSHHWHGQPFSIEDIRYMSSARNGWDQKYDCERHPHPTDTPSVRLRKAPVSVYELERCSVDSLTLLLLTTVYPWMTAACGNVPLPSKGMISHVPPNTWALRTMCRAWFIPFGIRLHSWRLIVEMVTTISPKTPTVIMQEAALFVAWMKVFPGYPTQ